MLTELIYSLKKPHDVRQMKDGMVCDVSSHFSCACPNSPFMMSNTCTIKFGLSMTNQMVRLPEKYLATQY